VGAEGAVHKRDVLKYLASSAVHETAQSDLVFCDPPYSSAGRLGGMLSELLPGAVGKSARIVTESDKRDPLRLELPLELERVYGDTRIAIHRVS
jgi:16S rRNA G966 N2-methylase RsmD